jgi:hypothetical protein
MNLFKPAETTSAFLKMGFMRFAGSGKTYTASSTAIGLIRHMRELNLPAANKPLFFLDTEKGSDWVARKIKDAGVELYTAKTRAFADLLAAVRGGGTQRIPSPHRLADALLGRAGRRLCQEAKA